MDDFLLTYQGFHPSEFTRQYLEDRLGELHDECPYGSTLRVTFTRHEGEFKGMVRIHSSAGNFFAIATDAKLRETTKKLVEQVRRQLGKWKSHRFEHKSIRNLERKSWLIEGENHESARAKA